MKQYATNFWALVLTCDFFNGISNALNLIYNINDTDNATTSNPTLTLTVKAQAQYTTYPTFVLNTYCSVSQKGPFPTCTTITTQACSVSTFCFGELPGGVFWCLTSPNKYLNLSTGTCGPSCTGNTTRNPDSIDSTAYCKWNCITSNNALCPGSSTNILSANYRLTGATATFTCNSNYVKVGSYCYLPTLLAPLSSSKIDL